MPRNWVSFFEVFTPPIAVEALKPTLRRSVPVMPAQAGIHDFDRIDLQAVDDPNKRTSPAMMVTERLWVTPKGRW
jgi:hypothetical protein